MLRTAGVLFLVLAPPAVLPFLAVSSWPHSRTLAAYSWGTVALVLMAVLVGVVSR